MHREDATEDHTWKMVAALECRGPHHFSACQEKVKLTRTLAGNHWAPLEKGKTLLCFRWK